MSVKLHWITSQRLRVPNCHLCCGNKCWLLTQHPVLRVTYSTHIVYVRLRYCWVPPDSDPLLLTATGFPNGKWCFTKCSITVFNVYITYYNHNSCVTYRNCLTPAICTARHLPGSYSFFFTDLDARLFQHLVKGWEEGYPVPITVNNVICIHSS